MGPSFAQDSASGQSSCLRISDSKVITCSASSAIKRQVHSTLINAEACTPAIRSHERWNVLTATLQNKHTAVHACLIEKYTAWTKIYSHALESNRRKVLILNTLFKFINPPTCFQCASIKLYFKIRTQNTVLCTSRQLWLDFKRKECNGKEYTIQHYVTGI